MGSPSQTVDLDASKLKPDSSAKIEPLLKSPNVQGNDDVCSTMNIMQRDMGRGLKEAVPLSCRTKPILQLNGGDVGFSIK